MKINEMVGSTGMIVVFLAVGDLFGWSYGWLVFGILMIIDAYISEWSK